MRGTPRKHYFHTKARGDLWEPHRIDRDRTTERVELGVRVSDALRSPPRRENDPARQVGREWVAPQ